MSNISKRQSRIPEGATNYGVIDLNYVQVGFPPDQVEAVVDALAMIIMSDAYHSKTE